MTKSKVHLQNENTLKKEIRIILINTFRSNLKVLDQEKKERVILLVKNKQEKSLKNSKTKIKHKYLPKNHKLLII